MSSPRHFRATIEVLETRSLLSIAAAVLPPRPAVDAVTALVQLRPLVASIAVLSPVPFAPAPQAASGSDPDQFLSPALAATVFPMPGLTSARLSAISLASSAFSALGQDPYGGFNLNNAPLRTYFAADGWSAGP